LYIFIKRLTCFKGENLFFYGYIGNPEKSHSYAFWLESYFGRLVKVVISMYIRERELFLDTEAISTVYD